MPTWSGGDLVVTAQRSGGRSGRSNPLGSTRVPSRTVPTYTARLPASASSTNPCASPQQSAATRSSHRGEEKQYMTFCQCGRRTITLAALSWSTSAFPTHSIWFGLELSPDAWQSMPLLGSSIHASVEDPAFGFVVVSKPAPTTPTSEWPRRITKFAQC